MRELQKWIEQITDNASWRSIAERLQTTHPTVQRRIKDSTASTVIDLANAYDTNPIPGLLAAKAITERQIDEYSRSHGLNDYTDLELAQEIVNRLQDTADHQELTTPTDELATRRKSNTTPGVPDGVYTDGTMPEDAVAKDGKEWGQPDDDDY